MREPRSGWLDPELAPRGDDEPAPLPRSALLPLLAGVVIVVIVAAGFPAGWMLGLDMAAIAALPTAGGLTLMAGQWNLRGPSRRNWDWSARRRRRQRAAKPDDLRIVHAKGEITRISSEPAAVVAGDVIPARPGAPPLPPPGVYHLTWQESDPSDAAPTLLSAHPARAGAGDRWLALIGAGLFTAATALMLFPLRHMFVADEGGFAVGFFVLLMNAELAVPAWLLAAEWRHLRRRSAPRRRPRADQIRPLRSA